MDRLIFTAMTGAERTLRAQQVHANNLANLDTPGFQADLELATSQAVPGHGYDDRYMARLQANSVSTRAGTLHATGRDLDVALQGPGYFAVQWKAGEAYARGGNFMVGPDGGLTVNGRPVLGDSGPIVLPPYTRVAIGSDGTVSVQPPGQEAMQAVDRLKLVKPAAADIRKNEVGLIVARDGLPLDRDESVHVAAGHLEGGNVSAVEEMISTMSLTRDFEMQMKVYKAADAMAETGNRLIRE
jgi:flagellar basal-body rod protein FlgF